MDIQKAKEPGKAKGEKTSCLRLSLIKDFNDEEVEYVCFQLIEGHINFKKATTFERLRQLDLLTDEEKAWYKKIGGVE